MEFKLIRDISDYKKAQIAVNGCNTQNYNYRMICINSRINQSMLVENTGRQTTESKSLLQRR